MERAEVEATEQMAQTCRAPQDYALWKMVGRLTVEAAGGLTQEQRAVFVAALERAVGDARQIAATNTPGRLAAAMGGIKPLFGFDNDED